MLLVTSCASHTATVVAASGATQPTVQAMDITKSPGTVYNVTLKASVVKLDRAAIARALVAISDDGTIFAFRTSAPQVADLQPQRIMLLSGMALRRVMTVSPGAKITFVSTEQAALSDAIQNGTIKWDVPIDFSTLKIASTETTTDYVGTWLRGISAPALADESAPESGEEEGWSYTGSLRPEGNRLGIDFTVKRAGTITLEAEGKGYVEGFQSSSDLEFSDGTTQSASYSNKNLNGHVDVSWTASHDVPKAEGIDPSEQLLKLPPRFKIPIIVGDFPFALEFSGAMLIKPGFSGNHQISHGHFSIDYNGVQGFSASKGTSTDQSEVHGEAAIDPDTHAATGLGSFGIVIAFALPKIELKTDVYDGAESTEFIPAGMEDMAPIEESEESSKFSRALSKFGKAVRKVVKGALETEAGVYVELILAGGVTKEGATSAALVPPCETTTLIVSTKFGADVTFLGLSLASPSTTKEILKRHRIDPAIQRCKDVAEGK